MKPEDIELWLSQTGPECDESSGVTNVLGARPIDTTTPRRSKRKALPDHSPSSSSAAAPKPTKKPRTAKPATAARPEVNNDTPTTATTTLEPKSRRDWAKLPWLEPPSVTTSEQDSLDMHSKAFMGMIGDWAEARAEGRTKDADAVGLDDATANWERDRNRILDAHRRKRTVREWVGSH